MMRVLSSLGLAPHNRWLNCQHILTESEREYDSIQILSVYVTFMLGTSFAVG
jgi:hypothetical protein